MSKHQSCFICHRGFVGPDSCIGNLCPECDAEVHGDCHQSIRSLEDQVEELEAIVEVAEALCDVKKWYEWSPSAEVAQAFANLRHKLAAVHSEQLKTTAKETPTDVALRNIVDLARSAAVHPQGDKP